MFQVEHFDEDFLCGLFFFFPFAFPDRGIITYDQIRGVLGSYSTHLPSSV